MVNSIELFVDKSGINTKSRFGIFTGNSSVEVSYFGHEITAEFTNKIIRLCDSKWPSGMFGKRAELNTFYHL